MNIYASRRVSTVPLTLLSILLLAVSNLSYYKSTQALSITGKSITVGSSAPSVTTTHQFDYNLPSSASVGSLEYEYCTNNPFPGTACTAPAGINVATTTISTQTGLTGLSVHGNTTNNRLVLTRAASVVGPIAVQHLLSNIVNPSNTETTIYVRISTFSSTDGTGVRVDDGGLAFSTSGGLGTVAFVPPYLTFCVGLAVALNCNSATGFNFDFGELSTTATSSALSQFSTATNDPLGYNVFTLGTTMTSGTNIIPSLAGAQTSLPGVGQFGLNLRDNSSPDVGAEPFGLGTGTSLAGYGTVNQYRFQNGGAIAGSPLSTDFTRFTVSYIVNVAAGQPAGIYSTTITYMAVAAF